MGPHSRLPYIRVFQRASFVVWIAAAVALIALLFALPAPSWSASLVAERTAARMGMSPNAVQHVTVSAQGSTRSARLVLDGQSVTLNVEPVSLRTPGFRVLVQDASGALREAAAPPSLTYRGAITEHPDWLVAATVRDGRLTAIVVPPGGAPFGIEPVEGGEPYEHLVYRSDAVAGPTGVCTVSEAPAVVPQGSALAPLAPQALKLADVAFDADYEFFQKNSSSVSATISDIENVMNGVNIVYERDCEIRHHITTIIVRSNPADPYTSTAHDTLYNQFRNEWNANQTGVERDLAHLMTGKNINGNVIGYSAVGAVCSRTRAYGFSESRYSSNVSYNSRVALTAHEIGHNWNADHCDGDDPCHIMCSSLGGCDGIGLPEFEPTGEATIRAFAASRTCLGTVALAVDPRPTTALARLEAPRPSPFRDRTMLGFTIPRDGPVRLEVYDAGGRKVAELMNGLISAGRHEAVWEPRGANGRKVGPGIYYARLEVDGFVTSRRLVLVR